MTAKEQERARINQKIDDLTFDIEAHKEVLREYREGFREYLTYPDELLNAVLRGHLIVEDYLKVECALAMPTPQSFKWKNNRFSFSEILRLFEALHKDIQMGIFVERLQTFNQLRNKIAHGADEKATIKAVRKFLDADPKLRDEELLKLVIEKICDLGEALAHVEAARDAQKTS